jgi:membrane-bound serine protease (ClpP class)
MDILFSIVSDPNIIYLILVFGLWFAVTALYVPGTGVLETMAGIVIVAAFVLLFSVPTNWIAALALVVGVLSFILIPFISAQYAPVAIGGLALQTVGTLFLFNGPMVSPLVLVFTLMLSLAYHRFVLMPVLQKVKAQGTEPDKNERVIGMRGRVQMPLDPIGTVLVDSEIWTATAHEPIEAGVMVVVVAREGLQLVVEPLKRKEESLSTANAVEE